MYRSSIQPIIQQALLQALLACIGTRPAAQLIATPKIELFTNVYNFTGQDLYSAFTLATFHGYAAQTVTWQAVGNLLGGDQVLPTQVSFAATSGGSTTATVRGYILSDGAANVYMGENFQTPVAFVNPGDFLDMAIKLVLKQSPAFTSS